MTGLVGERATADEPARTAASEGYGMRLEPEALAAAGPFRLRYLALFFPGGPARFPRIDGTPVRRDAR